MGKKQTLNVADAIAQDLGISTISTENNGGDIADLIAKDIGLTPSIQPYSLSDVEKDVEKTRLKEVQAEKSRELYDTRPEYAGLNKEEKEYLVKKEKEGALAGEDLARAAWTMAGNDPTQKKVASKDAKGNKVYSDLGELYKKGEEKGFLSSALTDIELSKYSGGNYYMKDRGDGTLVPVPLAYNEKPEAKNVKDAQVFSSLDDDAYGDSRFVDVAKKAWNIIPAVAQGFVSIPETVQGLITGETAKGYEVTKDVLEAAKFKTSQEFQKGIIDSQKIDEFSDFLSKDVYDLSPDKIINTVVNVASSLGEFAVTRKFVPVGGKAGTFAAGTVMNIKEPLQAAEDAGVEGRAKYAVAATYALAASGLETALGIEGKIFDDAATVAKKQMINKIIKDNVDVVGGKLTKESVENLYKETLKEVPSFYAKYAKNTVGEVTEEVAQNMIQNATQQIHDMVVKDDPEAAKFNTKFWSPEALAEYANSAFGGLIGGVAGSRFIKNKQSQTAYDAIRDGKENDLKVQLASSLKEGRLTQDDYDRAIFKIDSYKQYYEATKDRNVTDEEKRKIFDLTYEKENTKSGLENIKQNNPGGINDGLIAAKEQEVRDYTQQINDIWSTAEARTSESPVAEAKVQVPQWKTDLDTFSKEVGNADKQVSQNFVTKDKIETAVGASPQLNELSKPFSVDFKAPHLPEDAGNIQVRDGVLYEPYLEKQEGKEYVKTRQLPVYAMEDKDGGTWLFAVGQKTDLDAPDVSYLIKLNEEGAYEGHQEFKYETAKKNELTFDDIVPTFNKLGIKTASLTDEIKGIENIPQAEFEETEEFEEVPEEKGIVESEQFKNVYEKVKAGVGKAKLKLLPNNTVGVTIDGEDVPFASQRYLNKEDLPSGDVEVNVRTVENIEGKYGRGVLIETQEGVPLGYIRRAGKVETGRVAAEKISPTEDVDIDVPVELTDAAKEKIQQIEKDQENYELVEDELGRRYVNKKTGESYNSVSTFVSGKSGGDFKGDKRLKETAFKVGNIINGIVKDFFNGTIKSYSNYAENISRDDYDDIVRQLQDVLEYAKDKGYSIVTKPLIIADDVNKIAGQPNVLMVDENGKFYVYDVATLRNKQGVETKELLNKRYKDRPTNAERISAQVNILADILNNKYGLEVGKVGVIPFDVDYEVAKEGQPVQITQAVRAKRVDFKRKQILKPTGKTSAAEVKEKVEEVKPEEKKGVKSEINFGDLINKEIEKFISDKNTRQIDINEIALKSKDKSAKKLFEILKPYLKKTAKIYYQDGYVFKGGSELAEKYGYAATIDGKGNVLIFNKNVLDIDSVLHELLHDLMFDSININKDQQLINELTRLFDKAKNSQDKTLTERYSYAFNNLDEFVSEIFGNKDFRQELSYIPDDKIKKGGNIFDSISETIKKFLKRKFNFEIESSLLDNVFNAVQHTIIEKYKEERYEPKAEAKPAEKEVVKEEKVNQGEELKEIKDPKTGKTIKFYKVTPRQQAINEILSMVSRFHNLKRGRLGRNAEVGRDLRQAIKSAIAEFKEKFDDNIILEEQGMNRIEIKNKNRRKYRIVDYSFRNRTPVKDYVPLSERDAKVIELFDLLNEIGITAFPEIKGADGKRMSNKQLSTAISDVVNNVPTNGAKFLLKTLEGYVKDGMVEAEYAGAGQSQFIPLDDWMAALKSINVDDAIDENAKVEEEIFEQPSDTYLEEGWVDIVREEGDEDYPFQKAKSVKSIFDEAVKLFYKIRGTEGAAKKRNLTQERKELLKENPSVRFIDNNISSIFEQLEKQGIIKRKGNCP